MKIFIVIFLYTPLFVQSQTKVITYSGDTIKCNIDTWIDKDVAWTREKEDKYGKTISLNDVTKIITVTEESWVSVVKERHPKIKSYCFV